MISNKVSLLESLVGIVLLERMGGRGRVNPPPGTPFRADFNELLFVSIALTLTEIWGRVEASLYGPLYRPMSRCI